MKRQLRGMCALAIIGSVATGLALADPPMTQTADVRDATAGATTPMNGWLTLISVQMLGVDGRDGLFTIEQSAAGLIRARGLITYPDGLSVTVVVAPDSIAADPNTALDWQVVNAVDLGAAIQLDVTSATLPGTAITITMLGGNLDRLAYGPFSKFLDTWSDESAKIIKKRLKEIEEAWSHAATLCRDLAADTCGGQDQIDSVRIEFDIEIATGKIHTHCEFKCK